MIFLEDIEIIRRADFVRAQLVARLRWDVAALHMRNSALEEENEDYQDDASRLFHRAQELARRAEESDKVAADWKARAGRAEGKAAAAARQNQLLAQEVKHLRRADAARPPSAATDSTAGVSARPVRGCATSTSVPAPAGAAGMAPSRGGVAPSRGAAPAQRNKINMVEHSRSNQVRAGGGARLVACGF